MKVKEINGELVAVMSIKEAVFIGTVMANLSSTNMPQVHTVGEPLWEQYDYPEDFLGGESWVGFSPEAAKKLQEHVESILEGDGE